MSSSSATQYDAVPFLGDSVPHADPEFLETMGRLRGMQPVPAAHARVLELGCGVGVNLLPLAERYPQASYLGIDLSERQIAMAQAVARECSLDNVEFCVRNILDLDGDLGQFDYIIAHGLYSWVDAPVRDKVLAVCHDHLAPQGIAYVGYKTYPGWHLHDMIREMMIYQARRATTQSEQMRRARMVLDFLQNALTEHDLYDTLVQAELAKFARAPDDYYWHDHLERVNYPVYFHQFIAHARAHRLRWIGDGVLGVRWIDQLRPEVEQRLAAISSDPIRQEQYRDIIRNRPFRQTLLCHEGAVLSRSLTPQILKGLYLEGAFRPAKADLDFRPTVDERFIDRRGGGLSTSHALLKAALVHLGEAWPGYVLQEDLIAAACRRLAATGFTAIQPIEVHELEGGLLQCCLDGRITVHSHAEQFAGKLTRTPVASPLARAQARGGSKVSNRRHESVHLNPLDQWLLQLLVGQRTESQLIEYAAVALAAGELVVSHEGRPVKSYEDARRFFGVALPEALARLADAALLIG